MKTSIPFSLILAAASAGLAFGAETAYTSPVGYVTETLKAGTFNLIGLTVQSPVIVAGKLSAVTASSVEDSTVVFNTSLTAGSTYILLIKSGAGAGSVQEITSWGASSLVTQNLGLSGVAINDLYEIRVAATIASVFGATNQAGLLSTSSATTADLVWIPTGGGSFAKYYYAPATTFPVAAPAGWKSTGGVASPNVPIVYLDSIFVQRRGLTDLNLVMSGEVQTKTFSLVLEGGKFNYVGGVFPMGSTLGTSGLQSSVLSTSSATTADLVWIPDGLGGYSKYFYSPAVTFPVVSAAGWKSTSGIASASVALKSGMIIQRRGLSSVSAKFTPPPFYSDL